jgi:hypothetical protein
MWPAGALTGERPLSLLNDHGYQGGVDPWWPATRSCAAGLALISHESHRHHGTELAAFLHRGCKSSERSNSFAT